MHYPAEPHTEARPDSAGPRHDVRMPTLAVVAWVACLLGGWRSAPVSPALWVGGLVVVGGAGLLVVARHPHRRRLLPLVGAAVLVAAAAGFTAVVRVDAVAHSPVTGLAADGAYVEVTGVVVSDPRLIRGRFEDRIAVRVTTTEVTGRGRVHQVRSPLLVFGGPEWAEVELGSTVHTAGRLTASDDADLAGLLMVHEPPQVQQNPDVWWRASAAVRAAIRESVAHRPPEQAGLVPALVDGDDAALPAELEEQFRTTGLTHLTAVSGANLTLLVGFLLTAARWCGVRGRYLGWVAALGVVGFILLARTEPSVLRAAAMGVVGLLALTVDGRRRAFSGLGVAVVCLLLIQPALAASPGFALSVLATGGIVVLAPPWRDAMARWMPRVLAEAIAVPAAAQLACTPVVAAISGQVSLVAVLANLLAAPAVGPVTVLGLLGGVAGLLNGHLGALIGTCASLCVAWIIWVAQRGAGLPWAAVEWSTAAPWLVVLVALCVGVVLVGPWLLRRPRVLALGLVGALAFVGLRGCWGGPPEDWLAASCDIGQGDASVLHAGAGVGVLIDTGPPDGDVVGCLHRLGIKEIPLVVLSHFHNDHVGDLAAVLEAYDVGTIWTSPVLDPTTEANTVMTLAAEHGVPINVAPESGVVGQVSLRRLWPPPTPVTSGPGDGSAANDASVLLLAEIGEVSMLFTGDLELSGQAGAARAAAALDVDVVKVPHHGSRLQDHAWLESLHPEVALISVGADNDYGHPAEETMALLTAVGAEVGRTDLDGDLIVVPNSHGDGVALRRSG